MSGTPTATTRSTRTGPRDRDGILAPGDSAQLEAHVNTVIARLYEHTRHPGPTDPLTVTGEVLRGTSWVSYRAGRQRVASLAAVYVRWFAPTSPWQPTVTCDAVGTVITWSLAGPAAAVFDIARPVDRRGAVCDPVTKARVERLHEIGAGLAGDYVGVRVIALGAPGRSQLHLPNGEIAAGAGPEVLEGG